MVTIEKLPMEPHFTFVEDDNGLCARMPWRFQERVTALLTLNFANLYSHSYRSSNSYTWSCEVMEALGKGLRDRDESVLAALCTQCVYSGNEEDGARMQTALQEGLAGAEDRYCDLVGLMWSFLWEARLDGCFPIDIPAVLACGQYADSVTVHESTRRFARLLPNALNDRYIPNSKVYWFLEGAAQCACVADQLHLLFLSVQSAAPEEESDAPASKAGAGNARVEFNA